MTTAENRHALLKMVELIVQTSQCLEELSLIDTRTTLEDGQAFLQALNESGINTLKKIEISGGWNQDYKNVGHAWFNGRQSTVDSLLTILSRQTNLQTLTMRGCHLTEEQKTQI